MTGRHRVLDDVKRSEICALVAAGRSLRSVASYVGCDRASIRREELCILRAFGVLREKTALAENSC
jgi:hypothetical protein